MKRNIERDRVIEQVMEAFPGVTLDELPYYDKSAELDWDAIEKAFKKVDKKIIPEQARSIGLFATLFGHDYSSYGGFILFGKNRRCIFPDAIIRCARFSGIDRVHIHDQADFDAYPIFAIEEAIKFVERNTSVHMENGRLRRATILEYPPIAIREVITNAVLHADYFERGSTITVAIFDDRIEVTNPGGFMPNQILSQALSGLSILRNRVIANTFRELKLIEQSGSGLHKIIDVCAQRGARAPEFEGRDHEFRVTLYCP